MSNASSSGGGMARPRGGASLCRTAPSSTSEMPPAASYQRSSGDELQELGGRIAVPILGPVSPLDAIAPGSLLNNMTDHAAVAAGPLPTDVDGRRAWRVILSAAGADMFIDVDDETGILVQAQGADYPEPAFTITDLQTDDHRDAAWFAP
ncbi:hypothetical protein [Gordonia sp. NPDC127522]|uniref:hypothetical protein n=1 Tax=Gordonia sp. NPDC127522 TaxID=3345390 RepID=UPI003624FB62